MTQPEDGRREARTTQNSETALTSLSQEISKPDRESADDHKGSPSSGDESYRGYIITYDPKPIPPSCGADWTFYHKDYDGPEDRRCGHAASAQACCEEIDLIEDAQ